MNVIIKKKGYTKLTMCVAKPYFLLRGSDFGSIIFAHEAELINIIKINYID